MRPAYEKGQGGRRARHAKVVRRAGLVGVSGAHMRRYFYVKTAPDTPTAQIFKDFKFPRLSPQGDLCSISYARRGRGNKGISP